jgi:hypothetical protein
LTPSPATLARPGLAAGPLVDALELNGWIARLAAPRLLAAFLVFESGHATALAGAGWRGWGRSLIPPCSPASSPMPCGMV